MGFSVTHILIVLAVAIFLFGRGKISDLMGDVGKGISGFKKALAEEGGPDIAAPISLEKPPPLPTKRLDGK